MAQMHLSKMDFIGTTGFAAVAENRCPNSPKGANALQLAMGTIISDHLHTVSCGRFISIKMTQSLLTVVPKSNVDQPSKTGALYRALLWELAAMLRMSQAL